ncbi:MAG: ABC transporter permease [Cyanobacteria bacterium P01_A01_bin.3]
MAKRSPLKLITNRLLAAIPSLAGVVVVAFVLTRELPGDTAAYFAGPAATQEAIAQISEQLGLDKSRWIQFWIYANNLFHGDLGRSLTTGQPVLTDLIEKLPASLELTGLGLLFAISIAIPLGIVAALHPNSWIDRLARSVTTAGVSLPTFFTGLLLQYVLYYKLGWAPPPVGRLDLFTTPPTHITGFYSIDSLLELNISTFVDAIAHLLLPAFTLGIFALAPLARVTRASMLGILSSDFIRTARANGLPRHTIVFSYAFRNALLPIVTTLGVVFSFLLGANVLVEKVFAWEGIGSYAVEALETSDYAPIQGFVLTMATLYVLLNLAIDVLYGIIDPRVEVDA